MWTRDEVISSRNASISARPQTIHLSNRINDALATQVKKIVDKMVTVSGTNANLSKHFIAWSVLDDIVSRISTEMATQLQSIQWDTPRKPLGKNVTTHFQYDTFQEEETSSWARESEKIIFIVK
jgi:hypothetical protein